MSQAPRATADLRILEHFAAAKARMLEEMHKVIIGQDAVIELLLQALLSRGQPRLDRRGPTKRAMQTALPLYPLDPTG